MKNEEDKQYFKILIGDFAVASKDHLGAGGKVEKLNSYTQQLLNDNPKHLPNAIMKLIYQKIHALV